MATAVSESSESARRIRTHSDGMRRPGSRRGRRGAERLNGAFFRNGPNPQFAPRGDYHWFAGDGMIHGFYIHDGKVAVQEPLGAHGEMAEGTRSRPALFAAFNPMDTDPSVMGLETDGLANTNIVWHARQAACARRSATRHSNSTR